MNFNLATRKIPVKAKCAGCGNETKQYIFKTLASKHFTPISIAAGTGVGKCTICSDIIKTVEQEVTPIANGSYQIYTADQRAIDEQTKLSAEQAQAERDRGKLCVEFGAIRIASQEIDSANEHMKGTLSFKAWLGEDVRRQNVKSFLSPIRQPYGEAYSYDEMPLEIEVPENLPVQVNYSQFRNAAEEYIKQQIGNQGQGMNVQNTAILRNISLSGFGTHTIHTIEIVNNQDSAW